MRTHIDWLTFTMPMIYQDESEESYAHAIESAFGGTFGASVMAAVFGGGWRKGERSRAPYVDVWEDRESGITLFASPNLVHCCVEISGAGCEKIIAQGMINDVLRGCADRVTRVDIAVDIETSTQPSEFVAIVSHDRMRASGRQNSETGETCYVGSKKSDRYARVYRYYAPHPREHLLRIEHVFRRKYAKVVAEAILGTSVEAAASAAGKAFGWAHSTWDLGKIDAPDISITAPERNSGGTITWLVRSVAPAIRRLILDGTIRDPDAFFAQYFKPDDSPYA